MRKKIVITKHAWDLLEKEQIRRIKENWKNNISIEQIAVEAIEFFLSYYFPRNALKNNNGLVKE